MHGCHQYPRAGIVMNGSRRRGPRSHRPCAHCARTDTDSISNCGGLDSRVRGWGHLTLVVSSFLGAGTCRRRAAVLESLGSLTDPQPAGKCVCSRNGPGVQGETETERNHWKTENARKEKGALAGAATQ